ncbi:MAG: hypothetical protein MJZ82_04790 [Paludibacteraceae bacterium]|nr:hypothetical protein [Paludibacteraceae bacterium]
MNREKALSKNSNITNHISVDGLIESLYELETAFEELLSESGGADMDKEDAIPDFDFGSKFGDLQAHHFGPNSNEPVLEDWLFESGLMKEGR